MFTFGIFTTHIPYIAMVAFYAYFLIFGVDQANKGKIKVAEESVSIQMHLSNAVDFIHSDTNCFYSAFSEKTATFIFEKSKVKQKWEHFGIDKFCAQNFVNNTLFCRPPPILI